MLSKYSSTRYNTHLYHLGVQAGFYSDAVECWISTQEILVRPSAWAKGDIKHIFHLLKIHTIFILFVSENQMALNFLRRFRQQIILGSSVTSAWLAYTLVPHTVGLSYFKNWNRFVSNQQPDFEVFDGPTLSLIEQVGINGGVSGVIQRLGSEVIKNFFMLNSV